MGRDRSPQNGFSLAFVGDVMLGRVVNEMLVAEGPSYPFGDAVPLLSKADFALANLECAISRRGQEWMNPPRVFYFKADPIAAEALRRAGIDYVSLANNHTLDFGSQALEDTFEHLQEAGIRWSGAGKTIEEARRPAVLKSERLSVAVLAATDNFPEYGAGVHHPGTWHFEIPPQPSFYREMGESINGLRKNKVDLVVFSLHWGPNMLKYPSPAFRAFAHRLIDSGVDIVYGHSAHVFQGIEIYKGKIIFYDTGDFVDDYWVSEAIDEQFIYRVHGRNGVLEEIELVPVKIEHCQVKVADVATARRTVERMRERSAAFGTEVLGERSRGIIRILE